MPEEHVKQIVAATTERESLPPTTTQEENIISAGQRTINIMWETTQARIAIFTVFSNIILNSVLSLFVIFVGVDVTANQMALITLCMQPISLTTGIVIGFYFSRTNHSTIGGVGKKPQAQASGTR